MYSLFEFTLYCIDKEIRVEGKNVIVTTPEFTLVLEHKVFCKKHRNNPVKVKKEMEKDLVSIYWELLYVLYRKMVKERVGK